MSNEKDIAEIKKLIGTKKLIIGAQRTLKRVREGKMDKIFLSSNSPYKKDFEYYNKIGKVKVIQLEYANDELGDICKKPYAISVLGILKG